MNSLDARGRCYLGGTLSGDCQDADAVRLWTISEKTGHIRNVGQMLHQAGTYLMKRNRLLVETKVPVIKVMSRQSRKGRAMNFINLSTAALSAVLVLGSSKAFNLASYDDVKAHAAAIYDRIRGIGGAVMPPPPTRGEGPWPQSRIELFAKWMADGYQP